MDTQLFRLQVTREDVLETLQKVIGVVEKRQTMPILSNILLSVRDSKMSITGTDSEVELRGETSLTQTDKSSLGLTLPGRKLAEICRALPDNAAIELYCEDERVILRSGKSRFTLSTLPVEDFPMIEQSSADIELSLPQNQLRDLLQQTAAFMAQQDVRYYLNGLLLATENGDLIAVSTDGHRLAKAAIKIDADLPADLKLIIPRKGVLELMRLLSDTPDAVSIRIGKNHVSVTHANFSFVSRLIEGKFPDFTRVVPSSTQNKVTISRDTLKDALQRVMILCSEKYKAIRFEFGNNNLRISANNPQQESAEDTLSIDYQGEEINIGFNIKYLMDTLNTTPPGPIQISFNNPDQSVLLQSLVDKAQAKNQAESLFVIMPMRL